jgi:phosphatidylserine/phosphatidylglycerophosphate/cardiolipin synthase-like enzyme
MGRPRAQFALVHMHGYSYWIRLFAAIAVLAGVAGCASLPHPVERRPSSALATYESTPLYQMTEGQFAAADERSGFRLLPIASAAYETRIELTKLAQKTIDVQYYYFPGDNVGKYMMRALRNAAERGVRVRLLIDDLYTSGEDSLLLALQSTPNVEIRLFNPFPGGRSGFYTRFLSSFTDIGRLNHRMHNKLFIADNAGAVVGGRNMADEYFMRSNSSNFVDIDTFVAGPVVRDLSSIFDRYWNSEFVYPIESVAHIPLPPHLRQHEFDALTINTAAPPSDHPPQRLQHFVSLPSELKAGQVGPMILAHATALGDPVEKVTGATEKSIDGTVTLQVIRLMQEAKKEIVVASPYFVPGEAGIKNIQANAARGIHQVVLTNSLASTDEPIVYIGYAHFREEMLKAGVEIRELSPSLVAHRNRMGRFGKSLGGLHAKLAVIDQRSVFIGSMNLDERSAYENTEMGLVIDSRELAGQVLGLLDTGSSYLVRLDNAGRLQWVAEGEDGQPEVVFDSDPEVSSWLLLKLFLIAPFVPYKEL